MKYRSVLRFAIQGRQHDYTTGSITQAIFLLAIPMVLEMSMQSVFAVVDVFFVGRLGPDAVAMLGTTDALLAVVFAVALGLSMGTTALIARRIGEGREADAGRTAIQAIYLGSAIAIVMGIAGAILAKPLLDLMGAGAIAAKEGTLFTAIMLGGNITIMQIFLINAIFRGAGDAAVAMRALWLANLVNIILDPLLIFGVGPFPEMGLVGAAIATTIGRSLGVIYQLDRLLRGTNRIQINRSMFSINFPVIYQLLRISGNAVLQFMIGTASWVGILRIVSTFGATSVAGYTIAVRLITFAMLPSWGMGNAAATLVGQNLGAGRPHRAERAVWITSLCNMVFMGLIGLAFIFFSRELVTLFSGESTSGPIASECLRTLGLTYPLLGVGMVMIQAFNGAGDTRTPTYINLVCYWVLQIPLAYFLGVTMGLETRGVFISIALAQAMIALFGTIVFRKGNWKHTSI